MRKFATLSTAVALVLVCAAPAQAEKWLWFKVKGGAVAFDEDSRKTDVKTGEVVADTLIFYERPRPVGDQTYSFVAERLAFECRGTRHRWSQSAVLDVEGRVVLAREDGDWTPIGPEMGSTGLFRRVLCQAETPPETRQAASLDAVLKAIRDAHGRSSILADLAYPTPAPATPAPVARVPQATPAPVGTGDQTQSTARPSPAPLAKSPPPAASTAATVTTTAAPPSAGATYPNAPRCIQFKAGANDVWGAVNGCAYRVNYAWCMTEGSRPEWACGGPFVARVAGAAPGSAQTATPYDGSIGRTHLFACRAPGLPQVREVAPGRFEHECLGPAPAPAPAAPKAKAPAQPKAATRALPKLRPLSPG